MPALSLIAIGGEDTLQSQKSPARVTDDGGSSASQEGSVEDGYRAQKSEPVSKRLVRRLVHPRRDGVLFGVRFSSDGSRLVAGDFPQRSRRGNQSPVGIIRVWDATTGRDLVTIESGCDNTGFTDFFAVSPDWSTVYVPCRNRRLTQLEQGGLRLQMVKYDGEVRAWKLATGQRIESFAHAARRGVLGMSLSPNGKSFITYDRTSGVDHDVRDSTTIWDTTTRSRHTLPDGLVAEAISPDGKTVAALAPDMSGRYSTIKLLDITTAEEKVSIDLARGEANAEVSQFSPDGNLLVGGVCAVSEQKNSYQYYLRLWHVASGQELASFPAAHPDCRMNGHLLSPDGNVLVAVTSRPQEMKLNVFDLTSHSLVRAVTLIKECPRGWLASHSRPAFSPDGQWVAIAVQPIEDTLHDPVVEDLSQARIHLIGTANGRICETIVAPQGLVSDICFSPDGRMLATACSGQVLLWDLKSPAITNAN